jgi:N-acetylmuramoyl-L-alanine amidase
MRIFAPLALVASLLPATGVSAQDAGRDLYTAALAREHAVRAAFSTTPAADAALRDVHAIVSAYQALVRRFPASGYSDDALWQAGRLELDAYAQFGEARDKDIGVKLLRRLAADYPTSKHAKHVPDAMATLKGSPYIEVPKSQEPPKVMVVKSSPPPPPAPLAAKPIPAAYGPLAPIATVRSIKRAVLSDVVRIVIELDAEVPFHDERIADPDRLFVDLAPAQPASALLDQTLRFTSDSDIVRQVRLGKQANKTTRIVLDAGGVSTYSIYALYEPYRLVIDCVRGARPAPPPLPLVGKVFIGSWARKLPGASPRSTALIQAALAGAPPAETAVASVAPPDRNAGGGFSIARQLGLGVSRIVIDPGHGGHDPGAMGNGVSEAELVLDIALRVEKLLQKQPGTDVVLTRRTDDFVPLSARTAIANREAADLFLSIHANASEDGSARGIETYFLNFANNLSAASVAARENAASGQAMGALPDFVKAIALNNKLDESRDFATYVQRSMMEKVRATNKTAKDLGVKQAPFLVLIGAAMPSVLAEISFVTNPQEAKLLKSSAYRQRIADALFAAIKKYQTSLHSVSGQAASASESGTESPRPLRLPVALPLPARR